MNELMAWRNRVLAAAGLLLASCSVGPDFHRPAPPPNDTYYTPEKETAPDTGPAAAAVPPTKLAPEASAPLPKQALQVGADLPAQWWRLFKSPALDEALKLSLANSPTLAQATAALAQAQEEVRVAQAAFLPRLNADAGVQRNGNSEPGPQSQSTVYTMGLSASYAVAISSTRPG
jgi:outer membrane protein TolC